jgi:hypothetical protein
MITDWQSLAKTKFSHFFAEVGFSECCFFQRKKRRGIAKKVWDPGLAPSDCVAFAEGSVWQAVTGGVFETISSLARAGRRGIMLAWEK